MATSLSVGAAERNVRSVLSGKEEEGYVNLVWPYNSTMPPISKLT
jgi:hypothetical protein